MVSTSLLRLRRVLRDAGLDEVGAADRVPNSSNEVWLAGPYVVRLSARSHRFSHEAAVATLLPPEARHPGVVAQGQCELGEWIVVRRVPGEPLSRVWGRLREAQREDAIAQLAEAMAAIHSVKVGSGWLSKLRPPFLVPGSLECPHQLPLDRLAACLYRARTLAAVDPGLLEAVTERAVDWGRYLDGPEPEMLVHGDLHFENVLFAEDRMTAVVDFEFARAGWPDLDLDVLLRFCEQPEWHVAREYADHTSKASFRKVLAWLRRSYPALFEQPHLVERVNLFSLSYDLRDLLLDPPTKPAADLPPFHPVNRLARLVDGRGALQLIEW